jgi:hypothetical protein
MVSVEGFHWTDSAHGIEHLKKKVRNLLLTALKFGVSTAILAYVVWNAVQARPHGENVFANLLRQPKHWGMLAGAWAFCFSAVMLTFVRWWYLVRAIDIPMPLPSGMRISFLGYLFNLAPMGIVGGDVLKAVMLAHEYPRHRARSVASVMVDRLVGLYMLFVVAVVAILATGFWKLPNATVQWTCHLTFAVTGAATLGIALLMIPGMPVGGLADLLGRIPRIGRVLKSLIDAVWTYRSRPGVLLVAAVTSAGVHSLFATGVYLIARGLPGDVLSLATHFVVSPLSAATGVLPLPMGPFEFVLDFLYTQVPGEAAIPPGQGLLVALGYRLICILTAMIGVCYYLTSRTEVAEVMHEADGEG